MLLRALWGGDKTRGWSGVGRDTAGAWPGIGNSLQKIQVKLKVKVKVSGDVLGRPEHSC